MELYINTKIRGLYEGMVEILRDWSDDLLHFNVFLPFTQPQLIIRIHANIAHNLDLIWIGTKALILVVSKNSILFQNFELNSFSNAILRGGAKNIWMFSYGSDSQCPAPLIVMQFKLHSIGPWQLVKFVHFKKKKKNVTTFRNQKKKELNSYVCLKRPGLCNLTYI